MFFTTQIVDLHLKRDSLMNVLSNFYLMNITIYKLNTLRTGASSKGGKCAESPPTFICGKRQKNRRKLVMKNISDSGDVFTFEEGINTSHVCPKGQQP